MTDPALSRLLHPSAGLATLDQVQPTSADLLAGITIDQADQADQADRRSQARFDDQVVTADDHRQLETELGRRLYEHRHVGRDESRPVTMTRRDRQAEDRIRAALPAAGTIEVPVTDHRRLPDGRHSATLLGARVILAEPTETVVLSDVWPAISPGFLMVLGPQRPVAQPGASPWRLYLAGADLPGATATFAAVVGYLRAHATRWQAKVTSLAAEYPRSDAVTVYLDAQEDDILPGLIHQVLAEAPPSWHRTSRYVRRVAPGVGLAQEPDDPDPRSRDLSYGQHRASLVARHLLAPRHASFTDVLRAAGVDPDEPWRNLAIADRPGQ